MNQQVVSLSFPECEFYAIGSGCARGLTVKHVLQELFHTVSPDSDVKMTIRTDSDAARGMIHRVGCGRTSVICGTSKRCVKDNSMWFAAARKKIRAILTRRGREGNAMFTHEAIASHVCRIEKIPDKPFESQHRPFARRLHVLSEFFCCKL